MIIARLWIIKLVVGRFLKTDWILKMKVNELIKILEEMPKDLDVLVSAADFTMEVVKVTPMAYTVFIEAVSIRDNKKDGNDHGK